MNNQPTFRRRASRAAGQSLAVAAAVAALVALLGAGQALATPVPSDERVLERQGMIDHQPPAGQAGGKGSVALPPQLSSEDKAAARAERKRSGQASAGTPRRFIRPEPKMGPPPQVNGDQQVAPAPAPDEEPDGGRVGLIVVVAVVTLLLAAGGAASAWRARHRRPQPESTA